MEATAVLGTAVPDTPARPTLADLYAAARTCLPRHRRQLRGWAWDVDDVIHDTVLVAHRRIDAYAPPASVSPEDALAAWLYGIARRIAVKKGDRAYTRREVPAGDTTNMQEGFAGDPSPEAAACDAERREVLVGVLRGLRAERAEVLVLHARDGLSAPEIARMLGVNENTVKSRIGRAIRDVRAATRRRKIDVLLPEPGRRSRDDG